MGQPINGGADSAVTGGLLIAGTFGATGQSPAAIAYGSFNVSLWGTFVGSAQLERTFDGGTTWLPVSGNTAGAVLAWTVPFSGTWTEVEHTVGYRLNCTAYTSGTVNYRISQSSDFMWSGGLSR
ncbi:MAG TPA: hypothetical protein VNW90_10700 [Acetobacteraceae bacterium]|jgi:hypothetical protein|nr:hypothetical protein [Acetobacteraceae bacterium]